MKQSEKAALWSLVLAFAIVGVAGFYTDISGWWLLAIGLIIAGLGYQEILKITADEVIANQEFAPTDSQKKDKETKEGRNIRSCKSCREDVEIGAKECPHCGVANPALTKQDLLIFFGTLALIAASLSYCAFQPERKETGAEQLTRSETAKEERLPPATFEELKAAYETSSARASIIRTLRVMVEPMIEVPNRTQISQDLLDAKTACKNLSHDSYLEETPRTNKELADLYRTMNDSLSYASRAICDRIDAAIDLSSGTSKPAKAAEKFQYARQWYAHEWAKYESAAQAIEEELAAQQQATTPNGGQVERQNPTLPLEP